MVRRKKIKWNDGDIFLVPLKDGRFSVGQILDLRLPNCVRCAFYDEIVNAIYIKINDLCKNENLISLIEITRELLDDGKWKIIGNKLITVPKDMYPNEYYRVNNLAGSITHGAGLTEDFLNAFYALEPWDDWHNPDYLDSYLVDKSKKPSNLIYIKNR